MAHYVQFARVLGTGLFACIGIQTIRLHNAESRASIWRESAYVLNERCPPEKRIFQFYTSEDARTNVNLAEYKKRD